MKTRLSYRFFLMLASAILGIWLVGYWRPEPISSSIQKDKFWVTKVHSKKTYDVIVTGDSRVYRGIDPSSISKALNGIDVLNFGFSSGGHNPFIFSEIEKRLDETSKHKMIVLSLTPFSLTSKAQNNAHFIQENERDRKEVLLRRYVNPALSFFDPIKPTDIMYANDTKQGYYERFRSHGWVESRKIPYNNKAALKSYAKNFENNRIDNDVVQQVLSQVKGWTGQGIQVFAVRMPTTKEMEILENELSGYSEEELKKEFEKAGGYWIDYENRYRYTSYDGSHLDAEAAKYFSAYLGTELSKWLD